MSAHIENENIFFIVGVPRSGTTLLSVLLNNHSDIFIDEDAVGIRVLYLIDRVYKNFHNQQNYASKQDYWKYEILQDERLTEFMDLENIHDYDKIGVLATKSLLKRAKTRGKKILGDKSPELIKNIPELLSAFPNAKIIHVIRDPRANILSLVNRQYINLKRATAIWNNYNLQGLTYNEVLDERQYHIIKYEDILLNSEQVLKKVCNFLNVDFEIDMKDLSLSEATQKKGAYVKDKIDTTKLSGWEHKLSKHNLLFIERVSSKLMAVLGYEPKNEHLEHKIVSYKQEYLWSVQEKFNLLFKKKLDVMSKQTIVSKKVPLFLRLRRFLSIIVRGIFNENWFRK